jgi:thioesterase domain-containing protein
MSEHAPENLSAPKLEAFLHEQIPLTRAMGVQVIESNARRLVLEAPLDKNVNHLGTAFGGSLHALPTLACYAAVWTLLRTAGIDGHVVVKRSEASYRRPVTGRLRAVCEHPSAAIVQEFLQDFKRRGKARIELTATVEIPPDPKPAVEFHGSFVALSH